MYNWRQMGEDARCQLLALRQAMGQPWHSPPHALQKNWFHISAACYEHQSIVGHSPERLAKFERDLIAAVSAETEALLGWCVLPNHYHLLVQSINVTFCRRALGLLHGRNSRAWNLEDGTQGRGCWYRCLPRELHSERHKWAALNYIHHNPIHHGYVSRWQEWPFSSAGTFLQQVGQSRAEEIWREYPVLDMGKGWDDPGI
jgi:putative transposase